MQFSDHNSINILLFQYPMHPSFPSVAFSSSVLFLLSPVHRASCTHNWSFTSTINIRRNSVLFVLFLSSIHSHCIWSHLIQPNRNRCTQYCKNCHFRTVHFGGRFNETMRQSWWHGVVYVVVLLRCWDDESGSADACWYQTTMSHSHSAHLETIRFSYELFDYLVAVARKRKGAVGWNGEVSR